MIKKNISLSLTNYAYGLVLGTAEIIPGVSGSTLALLLGIYDDFIELLYQGTELVKYILLFFLKKKKFEDVKKQFLTIRLWPFGIPLVFGMFSAVLALSSIMTYLLLNYTSYLYAVLFALSLPTIAIIYRQIKKRTFSNFALTAVTGVSLLMVFINFLSQNTNVYQPHPLYLFFGGLVAISAMVLPGVSGSFMLLILGLYTYVISLISQLTHGSFVMSDVINLLFLVAGFGAGFLTTVRLLKKAFASYRDQLMAVLLGLLFSSWYILWPLVEVTEVIHDEPVLSKLTPTEFGLPKSFAFLVSIILLAWIVDKLHHVLDKKQKPVDDGFDRL
ncbi:MAG: DUF368 domain-containing protein [Candidatus Pacebacteria bacterium]|jgi:putative membrane protein|nr:DUF368 domain-containing protein [Candidatus Paceibacterota bacterium]MBT4651847.1 DUF368 domain-containing protein [Candidatus Paceibacterota bacterium]MBT6755653.1 DUF368 domain-containing protein [Candidatus Paceibacterota bacterium]MBT6921802.1 DUF368 domain-containing protein [Candidatus Paceibacterota bacterium]